MRRLVAERRREHGLVVQSGLEYGVQRDAENDDSRRRRGRSLYVFDADTNGTSTCYDDATYHCSKAWPPLLAHSDVRAGKGVSTSLLKTVKRTDGTVQVTYNGLPLYTFNGYHLGNAPDAPADTKLGDVHGQSYIGYWWVLSPAGERIKTKPPASG